MPHQSGDEPAPYNPAKRTGSDPTEVGPYRVLRRLGAGGMGAVYLAVDTSGHEVAVKVIRSDLAQIPEFRDRFKREADNARRVARFCTAAVIDVDVSAEPPYLVTEYVDGPTLSEAVSNRGPLSPAELHQLAVSMTTALMAIHRAGVVHRDLKPSNILLSRLGPKVIDFGIARALDTASVLSQDRQIGTPAFMAPEQALGDVITSAADVFAWGGVLIYAGTGRYPFGSGSAVSLLYRTVNDPPALDGFEVSLRPLVEEAMRKAPADRPTAERLYARLLDLRVDGPAAAAGLPLSEVTALVRPLTTTPPPTPSAPTGDAAGPITPVTGERPETPPPPTWGSSSSPRRETPPAAARPKPSSSGSRPTAGSAPSAQSPSSSGSRPSAGSAPFAPPSPRSASAAGSPGTPRRYTAGAPPVDRSTPGTDFGGALATVRAGESRYRAHPEPPPTPARGRRLGGRGWLVVAGIVAAAAATAALVLSMPGRQRSGSISIPDQVAAKAMRLQASDPELADRLALAAYKAAPESSATRNAMLASFGSDVAPITREVGDGAVLSTAFSPDGNLVATGSEDGTVTLWNVSDMANPVETDTLPGHTGVVYSLAFNHTGSVLASGSSDGTVRLWDVTDPSRASNLKTVEFHTDEVRSVAFSPDGNTLASGSMDGKIVLWDVTHPVRPVERSVLDSRTGGVRSVAFDSTGAFLAFGGGDDGTVRLWDVRDAAHPTQDAVLSGHQRASQSVAFAKDGTVLASGGIDQTVRLWDVSDPANPVEQPTISGRFGGITDVVFSPDASIVASSSDDKTVRLTDVSDPTYPVVLDLREHTRTVSAVAFAPDGNAVVSAGYDGTFRVWELDPAQLAETACGDPENRITAEEWAANFGDLAYAPVC